MALAAVLVGALLIIAALIIWQHASRQSTVPTYGVEDAVTFVVRRLTPEVRSRIGEVGVRRILEWEVFYLQGLAQENRLEPVETVAGPYEPAAYFIGERIEQVHGQSYSLDDIKAVLDLQVAYLASIGAIGDEVGGV